MRRAFALLLFVIVGAGCTKSDSSPTAPDATPTRIISLAGDLNYRVFCSFGQARNAGFTIANNGNSLLTVAGLSGPCSTVEACSSFRGSVGQSRPAPRSRSS